MVEVLDQEAPWTLPKSGLVLVLARLNINKLCPDTWELNHFGSTSPRTVKGSKNALLPAHYGAKLNGWIPRLACRMQDPSEGPMPQTKYRAISW